MTWQLPQDPTNRQLALMAAVQLYQDRMGDWAHVLDVAEKFLGFLEPPKDLIDPADEYPDGSCLAPGPGEGNPRGWRCSLPVHDGSRHREGEIRWVLP